MTCDETRDLLDRCVAGSLDAATAAAVRTHIDTCADCAADLEAARFLAPRVAALPRQVPVDPALWHGVETRLQRRPGGVQRQRWLAMAAMLLLALGAGWWLRGLAARDSQVVIHGAQSDVEALRSAVNDLEATLNDRSRLAGPLPESFRTDLRSLEAAIQEATAALNADPSNEVVRELYRAAFRRKLDALRQAVVVYVKS